MEIGHFVEESGRFVWIVKSEVIHVENLEYETIQKFCEWGWDCREMVMNGYYVMYIKNYHNSYQILIMLMTTFFLITPSSISHCLSTPTL